MAKIEPFEINGEKIWIECREVFESSYSEVGDGGFSKTSNKLHREIEKTDILNALNAICKPIQEAMTVLKPNEVSVELSLGFKADIGVFLASSESSAQLKISLKWKPLT